MTYTELAANATIAATLTMLDATLGTLREPDEDEVRYLDDPAEAERTMALLPEEAMPEFEARFAPEHPFWD